MGMLLKKSMQAKELPLSWREEGEFEREQKVTVWVEPDDPELTSSATLDQIMDTTGDLQKPRRTAFAG